MIYHWNIWIWERLQAWSLSRASENTNLCNNGVFLPLLSCNFEDQLSRNFHRFVISFIRWDTPGENTGLWQLPNVSSAFNILQDKIVFGFLMKKHKSWDFFTVVVILRSKVLNILKTILETWQSVWIIFHVLPVNTRKRYQLIMFHQLPLACFITQIEKKKEKKKKTCS